MILESQRRPADASFRQIIKAGDYFMRILDEGEVLRILDLEGNQAVDTLFSVSYTHLTLPTKA